MGKCNGDQQQSSLTIEARCHASHALATPIESFDDGGEGHVREAES